jgi:hypothetical protein
LERILPPEIDIEFAFFAIDDYPQMVSGDIGDLFL